MMWRIYSVVGLCVPLGREETTGRVHRCHESILAFYVLGGQLRTTAGDCPLFG